MIDPAVKLIAIVGPTASGKTSLSIELAHEFGGEIVCADSRTVFRGLDIGTAKPGAEERAAVPHHLLDVADPNESVTAASYKKMAELVVSDISERAKLPLVVGGSGLYVYGLLYNFQFLAGARTSEREALEQLPLEKLVEKLWQADPNRASEIDLKNHRRVVRALETVGQPRERAMVLGPNKLLLGLWPDDMTLNTNIALRTEVMFQMGLTDEVGDLMARYGTGLEVLRSPGYAETEQYLLGHLTLAEAKAAIILHTRQLAKRQLTWFKRNPEIAWFDNSRGAANAARAFLAS